MAYQFYFDGAEIPITPGNIKFTSSGNNKTYTLIDEGEINVLKLPGLQEITFDVLLPTQSYPFANNEDTTPITWLELFESYQKNKTPFQFVIVRTTDAGSVYHGTSLRCALESYDTEEDAEEYGTDVNVSVTLKEYKEYGTKTVVIQNGATSASAREQDNAPTTPATVDADKADNPVVMAKTYNNTSSTAGTIASKNNYGSTKSDGSFYRDYGPGTKAGSDNAAYVQGNKDKAASNKVTIPSSKKTASDLLSSAMRSASAKTGASWPKGASSTLLSNAMSKASSKTGYTKKTSSNVFNPLKSK